MLEILERMTNEDFKSSNNLREVRRVFSELGVWPFKLESVAAHKDQILRKDFPVLRKIFSENFLFRAGTILFALGLAAILFSIPSTILMLFLGRRICEHASEVELVLVVIFVLGLAAGFLSQSIFDISNWNEVYWIFVPIEFYQGRLH